MTYKTCTLRLACAVAGVSLAAGCAGGPADNANNVPDVAPVAPTGSQVAPGSGVAPDVTGTGSAIGPNATDTAGTGGSGVTPVDTSGAGGSDSVTVSSNGSSTDPAPSSSVPDVPVTNPVPWINENGDLPAGSNPFGIVGSWYAFGDGVTSTASGNPYREGMYCITGEAPGDEDYATHWGAGLGLDLNGMGEEKMPFEFGGRLTGFRMKLVGTIPADARVHFVNNLESEVTPFIPVELDESVVYSIADARVPLDWDVVNAGERVEGSALYSIQVMVPGAEAAGPIDLCIAEFEPVNEPSGVTPVVEGAYLNSDAFFLPESNTFGIQGPVYAIGDGNSTTQVGNPYKDGKYCVAGEFSGTADDWGAGIAFDLNKAPGGGDRGAYAYDGKIGGFRISLSGTTTGTARIQFVINEPQTGDQPFLVAQVGTTMDYRIPWAQVPTSWEVDNAGAEVGDSIYTVQLYLDGTEPGPFEVCVDEFLPLPAAELGQDAQPAPAGSSGFLTIDAARLNDEYTTWKARHYVACNDGSACVPRDEGDCISEGVGYGMLLAVAFDDREAFDALWMYYNNHKGSSGLMDWQSAQCGATQEAGWATDGDIDVAMALIQASCKWGGTFEQDARSVIAAIKTSIETCSSGNLLVKPGNFGGCNGTERHTNPSYLATGYFKVFATLTGDTMWTDLVDDSYALLSILQGKMDGLVPDWSDPAGNIPSGDRGTYGPDASRTPWRVATDYVWFGEARAVTYLDKVATYVENNGGIARSQTPNSNYRGALAMSGLQKDAATAQAYADAWLTTSVDDGSYFPGTLRPVYMLLLANKFPKACN